jgi:aspartate racemase
MEEPFYRERLERHGLNVVVPDDRDRALVHRIIFDELVHGEITAASRDAYHGVIERLVSAGAEGVILGCTEIELLISDPNSPVPLFPTTRLHVDAALAWTGATTG